MTYRPIAAAALALVALAACGKKTDEAQPGAAPAASAPGPVAAAEFPHPTPGLWESKMAVNGGGQAMTSRICYDEVFAKQASIMGQEMSSEMGCQQTLTRQIDGSLKMSATCKGPDGKPMLTEGVIRGDFKSAYSVEFTRDASDPPDATGMKIEARRVGDCPADFKPGDIEVNGMRMNMGAAGKAPATPAP